MDQAEWLPVTWVDWCMQPGITCGLRRRVVLVKIAIWTTLRKERIETKVARPINVVRIHGKIYRERAIRIHTRYYRLNFEFEPRFT